MDIGQISSSRLDTGAADVTAPTAVRGPEDVMQDREMIKAVKAIQATDLFGQESELTFVFDRETHRALVRVVNKETKEVVLQIPPEYVIRMAEERNAGRAETPNSDV